jgi:hypothetical protein
MKTVLSICIPLWLGVTVGAVIDAPKPSFWTVWIGVSIALLVITIAYIYEQANPQSRS